MKTKKPKRYTLAETFMNLLKEGTNQVNGELYSIYFHTFMLLSLEELQGLLEQYQEVALGKDKHFKSEGKTIWFGLFHKAIRQCDLFTDSYRKGEIEILTKEDKSELAYLQSIVYKDGYVKEDKDPKKLFNDEYRRYLELREMQRAEKRERSIGGHLDMILWNTIHVDKKNILKKTMDLAFKYDEVGLVIK